MDLLSTILKFGGIILTGSISVLAIFTEWHRKVRQDGTKTVNRWGYSVLVLTIVGVVAAFAGQLIEIAEKEKELVKTKSRFSRIVGQVTVEISSSNSAVASFLQAREADWKALGRDGIANGGVNLEFRIDELKQQRGLGSPEGRLFSFIHWPRVSLELYAKGDKEDSNLRVERPKVTAEKFFGYDCERRHVSTELLLDCPEDSWKTDFRITSIPDLDRARLRLVFPMQPDMTTAFRVARGTFRFGNVEVSLSNFQRTSDTNCLCFEATLPKAADILSGKMIQGYSN